MASSITLRRLTLGRKCCKYKFLYKIIFPIRYLTYLPFFPIPIDL